MGIAAREFELFCQPLVNARTRECAGVEILLRWNNPRQGWISPDVFIPLAEEHNLIVPLTRYVISETVRQIGYFLPRAISISALTWPPAIFAALRLSGSQPHLV